ncbi:MAG: D-alanyl-D-alanine carboxypeptidase/D-alanyl-D-alanine-endopeptidase [Acidobacteria bacterium RIFCSPLOWO2_02_FULL_68_18]|nr:MAG: D-alanyl-D-alanine carboxypeptidase/D-alanyl-D-alanine-endopeptidase [Acidobacteria bacterium RIFCSPLOWO2_02_FULL_68_18]OFW48414.1 MAG: D-alanyl-D-alanine carboxypeptidase/D-alanyl-D-alanine-endopeptidase [Acidobacteria bacterium RIFCSPLOWO2_12_FULL_68_19]
MTCGSRRRTRDAGGLRFRRCVRFAVCALSLELASCARAPAAVTPSRPDNPLQQLSDDITATITAPGVGRAAWGVIVESLDRGERLFELNPGTLLVPASTVKLVSLAGAVDAVGWGHQFETSAWVTGPILDGVLHGDMIVTGSGDPSIAGRGGTDLMPWIQALRKGGLHRIDGRIIGDDNGIEEPRPQLAWAWDDLGHATGALFGALNYAENRMEVTVAPAETAGSQATLTVEPHAAARPLDNRTVTREPDSMPLLWPEQRPGEPLLTIAGFIPAGAPPARLTVSVGNPTLWFANVLRYELISSGIETTGDAYDVDDVPPLIDRGKGSGIYEHRSPPLAQLAQPMLKESINLYGEAVLRLNAPKGVFPTNDAALEGLRTRLRSWGIADEAWQIVDGSGLSRRNAVAPEVLVAVLRRMYDASGQSPWMTALPVAGRDGTLAARMRGTAAEGNVRAKTGTMTNIRTLAGYVRTRDEETLAFAIMADAFEGSGDAAVEAIDRIAVRLATFSRRP